jgi:hypothetical protein
MATILSNEAAMQKLTSLRLLAAKEGQPFKLVRFVEDAAYAKTILVELLDGDSQEILLLAIDVMNTFGLAKVDHFPAHEAQSKHREPPMPDKTKAGERPALTYRGVKITS